MKKKFTFFLALCLLIFTAGAQITIPAGTSSPTGWNAGITATLPAGTTATINTGANVEGNLVVNGDLTISSTTTIKGTITVNAGGTLTVNGDLKFNNVLTVAGELTVSGNLTFNQVAASTMTIQQGGVVTANGTVNLAGPTSHIYGTLNAPGTFVLNSSLVMGCPGAIYVATLNNKIVDAISGSGYIEVTNKISAGSSLSPAGSTIVYYLVGKAKFDGTAGSAQQTSTQGVSSACATLPVFISDFNAAAVAGGVEISWTNQTEINTKGYLIQVSNDGVQYKDVQFVASKSANGTSSQPLTYRETVALPASGTNYYRIEQIGLDGKLIGVSQTKTVVTTNQSAVRLYPNPASNFINVVGNGNAAVRVLSLSGSVAAEGNGPRIDIQHLSSGVYFVQQFVDGRWTAAGKFIKK